MSQFPTESATKVLRYSQLFNRGHHTEEASVLNSTQQFTESVLDYFHRVIAELHSLNMDKTSHSELRYNELLEESINVLSRACITADRLWSEHRKVSIKDSYLKYIFNGIVDIKDCLNSLHEIEKMGIDQFPVPLRIADTIPEFRGERQFDFSDDRLPKHTFGLDHTPLR